MKWATCRKSLYYDLVRVPHGHIPAPMVGFWSWLPLPVKGKRDGRMFFCPVCGMPSFFKVFDQCRWCEDWDDTPHDEWVKEYERKRRREKWRARWKRLEYVLLPILMLTGKAWYIRSVRYHSVDFMRGRIPIPKPPQGPRYRQRSLTDLL